MALGPWSWRSGDAWSTHLALAFSSSQPDGSPYACAVESGRPARHGVGRGERGAATAELVVATPLLLLILMVIVQAALVLHAQHVADAAAVRAVTAARVEGGTAADGRAAADALLDRIGRGVLPDAEVTVDRRSDRVRVQVSGTARRLIPGLTLRVRSTADAPVERFVAPGDGGGPP